MHPKIFFIFLISTTFSNISIANISFCFQSQLANKKIINLKISIPSDPNERGLIRYKNSDSDIEIIKISEKSISPKKQTPATIQSKWQEQYKGKATGVYYLTTTGTNAGELYYIRNKDKKRFRFFDDRQNPDLNCGWD